MKKKKKILIGTHNLGKFKELSYLISSRFKKISPVDLGIGSPKETKKTFKGNSQLKAEYFYKKSKIISLSDDSGLSVKCLNGKPGIHSARLAKRKGGFSKAMKFIIKKVKDKNNKKKIKDTRAEFICCLTIKIPQKKSLSATGVIKGNDGAADMTVTGGTPPYSYSWSNGAITEDLFGVIGGDYTLTMTDNNGCILEETITIGDIVLATKKDLATANVSYYPNPAEGSLTVEASFEKSRNVEMALLDLSGRLMKSKVINQTAKFSTTINTSNLKSGQYLLVVKTDYSKTVERITIAH